MIFLHIGPHKTGSTSIQGFMAAHQAQLAAQGFHYPDIGRNRSGGHYLLRAELRDKQSELPGWAALAAMDAANPEARHVISCEGFENMNPRQIGTVAKALQGCDVRVVGYFREHGSLVQSQYLQLSRICRNIEDFDNFFERYFAETERLYSKFERWAEAFGWDKIQVRLFERGSLVAGDVVEDFLRAIGSSRAALKIEYASDRNLAPPWQAVEMMRAVYAEFGKLEGADNDDWMRTMRNQVRIACEQAFAGSAGEATKVQYLSRAQRLHCNELTRQDVEDLNARLAPPGLTMPACLSEKVAERPGVPTVGMVPSGALAAAMARLTLQMLQSADRAVDAEKLARKAAKAEKRAGRPVERDSADGGRPNNKNRKIAETLSAGTSRPG